MAFCRTSQNLYPIPHGPEMGYTYVHEQYTLVDSRFTVDEVLAGPVCMCCGPDPGPT